MTTLSCDVTTLCYIPIPGPPHPSPQNSNKDRYQVVSAIWKESGCQAERVVLEEEEALLEAGAVTIGGSVVYSSTEVCNRFLSFFLASYFGFDFENLLCFVLVLELSCSSHGDGDGGREGVVMSCVIIGRECTELFCVGVYQPAPAWY